MDILHCLEKQKLPIAAHMATLSQRKDKQHSKVQNYTFRGVTRRCSQWLTIWISSTVDSGLLDGFQALGLFCAHLNQFLREGIILICLQKLLFIPTTSPHQFDITHFARSSSGSSLSLPHLLGTRHSGSGHSYPYGSQLKPRKNEVSVSSTLGSYGCYFPVGITLRSSYLALLCQHPGTHLSSSSSEASPDCQWWDRGRRVYRNSWCAGSTSPQSGDFPAAMPLLPVSPSNSCHPEPWLLPEQSNERSDTVTRAFQRALFSAGSCWKCLWWKAWDYKDHCTKSCPGWEAGP